MSVPKMGSAQFRNRHGAQFRHTAGQSSTGLNTRIARNHPIIAHTQSNTDILTMN